MFWNFCLLSIKTTSPHESNLKAEIVGNFAIPFFVCLVEAFGANMHHGEET